MDLWGVDVDDVEDRAATIAELMSWPMPRTGAVVSVKNVDMVSLDLKG